MEVKIDLQEPSKDKKGKLKRFIKQKRLKIIAIILLLIFGGLSTKGDFWGGISSLLEIIAIALCINLVIEWRCFEREERV